MGPVTHDIQVVHAIGVIIIMILAVPVTIVPIFYYFVFPWREYLEGKAVMISAVGLALLVDLSLLFKIADIPLVVKLGIADGVYALVLVGSIYKLAALIRNWIADGGPARLKARLRHRRAQR